MKSPRIASFWSTLVILSVTEASLFNHETSAPGVTPSKEQNENFPQFSLLPVAPSSAGVLWIRPTTTILDTDTNRYQNDFTRVLSISRGGGWFSDVAKDVEGSTASVQAKAQQALASASRKTTTAVANAKSTAEQGWLKRVQDLEQRLRDEKVKASKRLETEQKRWKEQADKDKAKLQAQIEELRQRLKESKQRR